MGVQMTKSDVNTAKLWDSLKTYELEPPFGDTIAGTDLLQRSVNDAIREEKLFSKIRDSK